MSDSILLERRLGLKPDAYKEDLLRRRVFILPTRNGILFGFMILVLLIGAINYENNLAYLLTFLLSSLTLVGIFYTYRNIAGLIITPEVPKPVFLGEKILFPFKVDNLNQDHRYSLLIKSQAANRGWFKFSKTISKDNIIDIEKNCIKSVFIEQESSHRGIIQLNRLHISTVFPLGLFGAWAFYDFNQQALVYPKPQGTLPFPNELINQHDGNVSVKQGHDDFIGNRKYRLGDSSKQIDWKAYARERGLHSKLFEGKSNCDLTFHLQHVSHLDDIETALSQLCQWLIDAETNQYTYGLQIGDTYIEPNRGSLHLHQCLRCLALYGQ